jgi:hypothetical protein
MNYDIICLEDKNNDDVVEVVALIPNEYNTCNVYRYDENFSTLFFLSDITRLKISLIGGICALQYKDCLDQTGTMLGSQELCTMIMELWKEMK